MNRAMMLRITACAVMGLGAALLVAALLLSTYTAKRIAKIPLDIDTTLVSTGSGATLSPDSLAGGQIMIDLDVPLTSQQQITVETPANSEVVTLQAGTSVRRADMPKDTGLLLAIVDTVVVNRSTAMAASDDTHPGGAVQKPRGFEDNNPPTNIALPHEGLSYRFPFHTKKMSYQFFDPIAQKAFEANYDGEDDVNGLTTYRFTQTIGYDDDGVLTDPLKYASLYAGDVDGQITALAGTWGVEGDPNEHITMTRYYAAERTMWVDPVSGTIVKMQLHANHYFARDPLVPETTVADYTVVSDEDTVEAQVDAARNERDRIALWSRVLPTTFAAAGLITLIGGGLIGWLGLPAESALAGGAGMFGKLRTGQPRPVPGAEAQTEKLPAQKPAADGATRQPGRPSGNHTDSSPADRS